MGRHRPSAGGESASDLIARLQRPPEPAETSTEVSVSLNVSEPDTGPMEPPTIPIRVTDDGRIIPVPPHRLRVATGFAVGLAVTGLVTGDVMTADAETARPSISSVPTPLLAAADPPTDEEVTVQLREVAASRALHDTEVRAAQAAQLAAEQAAIERRAEEERLRQEAEAAAEAAAAAQAAQEAAEEAARDEEADPSPEAATTAPSRGPAGVVVPGARLTSGYGSRWGTFHYGIDLAAPLGSPIYSPISGVVRQAGPASGFGNAVYIAADDGTVWVFGHMRVMHVSAGERVNVGTHIADVGNEGQSTGPHVHVERHVGGERTNPAPHLGL